MTFLEFLNEFTPIYIALVGILGLMVGSFLNVVIYRLPVMMEREWQMGWQHYEQERREAAQQDQEQSLTGNGTNQSGHAGAIESTPEAQSPTAERFNLAVPKSRCPSCGTAIQAWQNIPVVSYLWLGGKCAACKTTISIRYPLVEAFTALLSMVCAIKFGVSIEALSALVITWCLVALSGIDFDTQLLPDSITLPLLWLGLLASLVPVFANTSEAIIGAAAGYMSLWLVYWAFKLLTGKEGMGFGDFKLLAALGAWFGWQALPMIILLSSVVGAIVGITLIVVKGRDKQIPIPFGPYLAAAGWLSMILGEQLSAYYFNLYV